jgi:hypothetical protein
MNRIHTAIVLALALAVNGLTACGKSEPKPPPKAEDTVFAPYLKAKDRAVQETQKAMEANQQKLDDAMKKNDEKQAD